MYKKLSYNLQMAFSAIGQNKIRAVLTSLGVMFGVSSVIAMLSIGRGAEEEILQQMKLLGVNNIIIKRLEEQKEEKLKATANTNEKLEEKKRYSPGLTIADALAIQSIVPHIRYVVPEALLETSFVRQGFRRTGKLVGVSGEYFTINDFQANEGNLFNVQQLQQGLPVCVIGQSVKKRFFAQENPLGQTIKCGQHWLKVVGVLKEKDISERAIQQLGIRDYNMDVFIPIQTYLLRYENRNLVTLEAIKQEAQRQAQNDEATTTQPARTNYHQIDRITLQVEDPKYSEETAIVLSRMLQRRHNQVVDFEIVVPQQLLAQEKRTRQIFNIVLGAIASISLIVGGIGIMNIMLASVMERIKEIGIRRSLGATKQDVLYQFIGEAVMISLSGGIIGILVGVSISYSIEFFTEIPTIISTASILLSFGVAASIGLIFGVFPARRAAQLDPIVALRYE